MQQTGRWASATGSRCRRARATGAAVPLQQHLPAAAAAAACCLLRAHLDVGVDLGALQQRGHDDGQVGQELLAQALAQARAGLRGGGCWWKVDQERHLPGVCNNVHRASCTLRTSCTRPGGLHPAGAAALERMLPQVYPPGPRPPARRPPAACRRPAGRPTPSAASACCSGSSSAWRRPRGSAPCRRPCRPAVVVAAVVVVVRQAARDERGAGALAASWQHAKGCNTRAAAARLAQVASERAGAGCCCCPAAAQAAAHQRDGLDGLGAQQALALVGGVRQDVEQQRHHGVVVLDEHVLRGWWWWWWCVAG
jgi:hypothetical protein